MASCPFGGLFQSGGDAPYMSSKICDPGESFLCGPVNDKQTLTFSRRSKIRGQPVYDAGWVNM